MINTSTPIMTNYELMVPKLKHYVPLQPVAPRCNGPGHVGPSKPM